MHDNGLCCVVNICFEIIPNIPTRNYCITKPTYLLTNERPFYLTYPAETTIVKMVRVF